jgi:hypothetical protein
MKPKCYYFSLLVLFSIILSFQTMAQQNGAEKDYYGVIKVRPLQYGEYFVSWERVKEKDQTNEIGLGYIHSSFVRAVDKDRNTLSGFYSHFLDEEEYVDSDANGLIMRMSQRNYTVSDKDAPEGFYYGPVVTFRFIAFDKDLLREFKDEVIGRMYQYVLAFHYQVGYQKLIGKHLSMEVFGGLGVRAKMATAKISKGRTEDRIIGPLKFAPDDNSTLAGAPALHLNVSVGYAF